MAAPVRTALTTGSNKTTNTTVDSASVSLNAGDMLVVLFAGDTAATSVTWNANNLTAGPAANNTGSIFTSLWYLIAPTTTSAVVTMNYSSADAKAWAISKITNVRRLVTSNQNTGTGTTPTSGNVTTVTPDTALIGAVGTEGPSGDTAGTWGNSFSAGQRSGTTGNPAAGNITVAEGYRILTSTTTTQISNTGQTDRDWATVLAAFDNTWYGFAQVNAKIRAFNVQGYAQAQAQVGSILYFRDIADRAVMTDYHTGYVDDDPDVTGTAWETYPLLASSTTETSKTLTSVTGPTGGRVLTDGTYNIAWISPPIGSSLTLSGNISISLKGQTSSTSANAGIGIIVKRIDYRGSINEYSLTQQALQETIVDTRYNGALSTSPTVYSWTASMTSTTINKGDRLWVAVVFDDYGGTMASGHTLTFTYNSSYIGFSGANIPVFESQLPSSSNLLIGTAYYLATSSLNDYGDGLENWAESGSWALLSLLGTDNGSDYASLWNLTSMPTGRFTYPQKGWYSTSNSEYVSHITHAFGQSGTLKGPIYVYISHTDGFTANLSNIHFKLLVTDYFGNVKTVWSGGTKASRGTTYSEFILSGSDVTIGKGDRLWLRYYLDDTTVSTTNPNSIYLYYGNYPNTRKIYINYQDGLNPPFLYGDAWKGRFGLAQAEISSGGAIARRGYGQAQAEILKSAGYAQSQARMLPTPVYYYLKDTFTRTTSPGWGTSDNAGDWSTFYGSYFSTDGSTGIISHTGSMNAPIILQSLVGPNSRKFMTRFKFKVSSLTYTSEIVVWDGTRSITSTGGRGAGILVDTDGSMDVLGKGDGSGWAATLAPAGFIIVDTWYEVYIWTDVPENKKSYATVWKISDPSTKYSASVANPYSDPIVVISYISWAIGLENSTTNVDDLQFGPVWFEGVAQAQATIQSQSSLLQGYAQALGQIGVTDNLYTAIDEATYNDLDYIVAPSGITYYEVAVPAEEPDFKQDHFIHVRACSNGGPEVLVKLYQGTTYICESTPLTLISSFQTFTYQLSEAEITSISDYSDLRLRFVVDSGTDRPLISWLQLQLPPAGTKRRVAQAQATITAAGVITYSVYAQSQAQIKQTYRGYGQALSWIKTTAIKVYAQAQSQIKQSYLGYAQAQTRIKQTYYGYAQAQSQLKQTYRGYAQAQSQIKQTYQGFSQAQATVKTTYRGYAQAQTWIKVQAIPVFAQANAYIKTEALRGYAQAQAWIKTQALRGYAQAQAAIKTTYQVFAQSQAYIRGLTSVFAQAQSNIKTTYNVWAQANSWIKKTANNGYAQALAWIKTEALKGFSQAQATIKQVYRAYSQSQAQIKTTYQVFAQANAYIRIEAIKGYAQAQAHIKQTYRGYAQSQAQVKQTYQGFSQAQAQIKQTYRSYAQAQAQVRQTYRGYSQAQAQLRQAYLGYAQAMAQIKQTYRGYAQAQGHIKATYLGYAQALGYIKTIELEGFGQALATISAVVHGHGQANAWIYLPQIARPVSDIYNADGWVGTVRD